MPNVQNAGTWWLQTDTVTRNSIHIYSLICDQQLKWWANSRYFLYSSFLFLTLHYLLFLQRQCYRIDPSSTSCHPFVTGARRALTGITCTSQHNQPTASNWEPLVASRQSAFKVLSLLARFGMQKNLSAQFRRIMSKMTSQGLSFKL